MIEIIPELIEVQGRRRVKLTLRDGDTILDADVVDPLNSTARRKVAQRLAGRSGDVHAVDRIEQGLLQCVDLIDAAKAEDDAPDAIVDADDAPVIDASKLVRAELMLTPTVVGISVSELVTRGGRGGGGSLAGRWRVYLSGAADGGSRRSVVLDERIACPSSEPGVDEQLWVHPLPPSPSLPITPGWSDGSRRRWLDGEPAPKPHVVFAALREAFDAFVDFPEVDEKSDGVVELSSGGAGASDPHSTTPPPNHSAASAPAQVLALWTMLTYCFPAWDAVPYLFVTGPAGSGKTRVFELLSRVVFRGFTSSNLSAAALFRTLHERGGTLLLDEAERLLDGSAEVAELRSILLAGYKRGGKASRLEASGDSYQMTEFGVFGPKAIACINGLPGPLASRCISIHMFRSPPESDKPRLRLDVDRSRWSTLRDELHRLALGPLGHAAPTLANLNDACALSGRAYELWQPLLSIAQWLDASASSDAEKRGTVPLSDAPLSDASCARTWVDVAPVVARWARALVESTREETVPEAEATLLRVLCDQVRQGRELTATQVLNSAKQVDGTTFRNHTPRKVSDTLRRYQIYTSRSRGRSIYRVATLDALRRTERYYGVDLNTSGEDRPGQVQVRLY